MIGIFGGTFDPIHYGHLRPAHEIMSALQLQKLFLVPAAIPPHRQTPIATAEQRLQLARLATEEFRDLTVDDCEIRRGGLSYTVDTLRAYRQQYPQMPLCLVVGSDAFLSIESWHQWQQLPALAHLVVMQRPGHEQDELPRWSEAYLTDDVEALSASSAGKIYLQTVTLQDISATAIRQAIGRQEDISHMLPAPVLQYIQQQHLYE